MMREYNASNIMGGSTVFPGLWKTILAVVAVMLGSRTVEGAESAKKTIIADKTLVSWVIPAGLRQQGGGVISLMNGEKFDALVLGEKRQGTWMAGSDMYKRTQADQSASPLETVQAGQQVQIAIVYAGNRITIYRNGQRYSDYDAGSQESFDSTNDILIGARYRGPMDVHDIYLQGVRVGETGFFAGDIEEVRLYDQALDERSLQALQHGRVGQPKPLGMWTFDEGAVIDRMGNYPKGSLMNGAAIVDGKLRLGGRSEYALVSTTAPVPVPEIQAGFFTPKRSPYTTAHPTQKGAIWDTWLYFHDGLYYMYYIAGPAAHWDGHELAISEDGVHWKEHGVVVRPREGVTWIGTGHIWKSPDFDKSHKWIMNYSEGIASGRDWQAGDKQDIMFVTSTDLLHWRKVDEEYRFVQDARWYQEKGRWDCIDTVQRPDGRLYGYFTANPDRGKVPYEHCGFGFAESKDGITWTALPPVEGNMSGEFGGIQKIGDKYYVIVGGAVGVGDKPEGPFYAQKKNASFFGASSNYGFVRFFHNAPGGPLVNHFFQTGTCYAAPLKAVEIDREGILRLKWWKNNDKLKARPVTTKLIAAGKEYASSIRILDTKLDPRWTTVIEGAIALAQQGADGGNCGIFFDHGNGQGQCLILTRHEVRFGEIKADGSDLKIYRTSNPDMDFGPTLKFRLVIKDDMMEFYVNDYLISLNRVKCNGRIGFMGADNEDSFKNIKVWQSN